MSALPRRIGVISNPRSHAYRAGIEDLVSAQGWPDAGHQAVFAEPGTLLELAEALRHFAANAVDLLIVHGGDGTVRDVLTLLPDAYPQGAPELAIMASGNTNLAARVLGRIRPGDRGLRRFVEAAQAGRLKRSVCETLQVSWPDGTGRLPVRGLFFGAGLYAQGKRLADAKIHSIGLNKGPAVGIAVLSALAGALLGRRGTLRQGTEMRISLEGRPAREGRALVFMATTLDRLMLGFWPFGTADAAKGGGLVHWLDIEAPPRRLAGALLAILLRRHSPRRVLHGHHLGQARRIALRLVEPFVLDGEFFEPGPGGVVLSPGGQVTIVRA